AALRDRTGGAGCRGPHASRADAGAVAAPALIRTAQRFRAARGAGAWINRGARAVLRSAHVVAGIHVASRAAFALAEDAVGAEAVRAGRRARIRKRVRAGRERRALRIRGCPAAVGLASGGRAAAEARIAAVFAFGT